MPRNQIIHRGSVVAQDKLFPVGKQYVVSDTARDLVTDLRNASCEFGNAKEADMIEAKWVQMQTCMAQVMSWISTIEKAAGQPREAVMEF